MERLAKYIIIAASIALIGAFCWYFREVISYILLAAVFSLVATPIARTLRKIRIRKFVFPKWLASILSIVTVLVVLLSLFSFIIPIISNVIVNFDTSNLRTTGASIELPLMELNRFLIETFPALGPDFKIESALLHHLGNILDVSTFTSIIGSAAGTIINIGVGLFAIVFISFFFINNDNMFKNIILSFVNDKYTQKTGEAIEDMYRLLSRYFIGLIIEVIGVALINTIGLHFVAGLTFSMAVGIAFMTGLLNIIPYVGPFAGGVIGTFLGLILKYYSASPMGIDVSFWGYTAILVAIFVFAQLIDNYIFQPIIYSNSVKAHPLEIFIVLLMAGYVGGVVGMLIAIPSYTVIRVFAAKFLSHIKFVRMLTGSVQEKSQK
ncbi:hypothetical protein B5F83_06665 [Muribaculum sp. An289]|nr:MULTISPECIES: AI-2E family transporter [unclassified Muribaculum]OUO37035.1 hypothetical protein B5F83_06665 [Muribaculum sp. An289]OUO42536.1 hypothetical protein B5F81_07065 [Muribaculum sp. An287]